MQQIAILSGKGGTGKTSIASALASYAGKAVFVDCDVDAADLYIIFQPQNYAFYNFEGGEIAQVDQDKCTNCNLCLDICRFDAISEKDGNIQINPYQCEGCRLCANICPVKAIEMKGNKDNKWFVGNTRFGKLVHARLAPGEDNSGKLVTRIREEAKKIAKENNNEYIIIDGPPGIGCPVISSLSGVDKVLIVTEPSVSGLHDLKRLNKLLVKMKKKTFVLINKADLNFNKTKEMEMYCQNSQLEFIGKLPYNRDFTDAMIKQQNINEYKPGSELDEILKETWNKLK